jgi:hypothetical protein
MEAKENKILRLPNASRMNDYTFQAQEMEGLFMNTLFTGMN